MATISFLFCSSYVDVAIRSLYFIAHKIIIQVKVYSVLNLGDRNYLGLIQLVDYDYVINVSFFCLLNRLDRRNTNWGDCRWW